MQRIFIIPIFVFYATTLIRPVLAEDWPMWRYNSVRSNASPANLPDQLNLSWTRQLPTPRPAWPASQTNLQFDSVCQPIVTGNLLIVGSTTEDTITAYKTDTGEMAWQFFTNGPVRFAPVASGGQLFVGSDDGYLYCLQSTTGKLKWKVNGGPTDRPIIGNNRLVSTWPVRGGPVAEDGVVYFTASIWPFMGIFVHAVDAESGAILWTNSETGSRWMTHPHGAPSFGSIVPQGYLAVSGNHLIVPGGRSLPAVFDRQTGELLHFQFGRGGGGWSVTANDHIYATHREAFGLTTGKSVGKFSADVLTNELLIHSDKAYLLPKTIRETTIKDRRGRNVKQLRFTPTKPWEFGHGDFSVVTKIGDKIYTGDKRKLACFPFEIGKTHKPLWSSSLESDIGAILAGDGKLFVVTKDAKLHCFSEAEKKPQHHALVRDSMAEDSDQPAPEHKSLIELCAAKDGYAVIAGSMNKGLLDALLRSTRCHVVVLDTQQDRVRQVRLRLQRLGLYGSRATAHVGDLQSFRLPPYLVSALFAANDSLQDSESAVENLFETLRPYGGRACIQLTDDEHRRLASLFERLEKKGGVVRRKGDVTVIERAGPLPGSSWWTHQYGDAANSVVSKDRLVKAPLGLLWFGGPPNDKVLPRHGHGPSPQVAGGRLVIEGADMLRSVDVYTGRVFWERELPGLGTYYDKTTHFPGAGEIGSNYVTLDDAVYVVYGRSILQLDAATGQTEREFKLADSPNQANPTWGFIAVDGNYLVATSSPVKVESVEKVQPVQSTATKNRLANLFSPSQYSSTSRRLVVFDRKTGKQLWSRTAEFSFRHNCIVVTRDKVFCIDSMSPIKLQALKRRGVEPQSKPQLLALNVKTGKEIWSSRENVFGTFLNYSTEHDILLQAGSAYRDRARDEVDTGMVAYRGRDGSVVWQDLTSSYNGPCLLWQDKIITNGTGGYQLELLTGKKTDWRYRRMYGCNTVVGSQHLLTFRSGAAGYCDLTGDSGTGNVGGFRSSCTSNLIIADGVFNAPDYTRTCTCAYQNQSSLAMIHMPEAEMWTFSSAKSRPGQFGVNLGAPGDRRGPAGLMWYDLPSIGGSSPDLPVTVRGNELRYLRRHTSLIEANSKDPRNWVASSAAVGITEIVHKLPSSEEKVYRVRLYFAELENVNPGERLFDVAINGQTVIEKLDVAKQAGGTGKMLVHEIPGVRAGEEIKISLTGKAGSPILSGYMITSE